ncbi:MAG TPA: hypothetical protein VKE98_08260, partial [Gemmataceae bacterium]|nr:hypothetical protein [Gemmataceae bacterium]
EFFLARFGIAVSNRTHRQGWGFGHDRSNRLPTLQSRVRRARVTRGTSQLPDVRLGLGIVVYEITADCGRQSA